MHESDYEREPLVTSFSKSNLKSAVRAHKKHPNMKGHACMHACMVGGGMHVAICEVHEYFVQDRLVKQTCEKEHANMRTTVFTSDHHVT